MKRGLLKDEMCAAEISSENFIESNVAFRDNQFAYRPLNAWNIFHSEALRSLISQDILSICLKDFVIFEFHSSETVSTL